MDNTMQVGPSQDADRTPWDVAVVGGGIAGLSAACDLTDSGLRVCVLERRPYVGGRASSYMHPGTGEVVDNCQHILLGCCTNLVHFYQRLGVLDRVRWYDRLVFLTPGGGRSDLFAGSMPPPLHSARSFLAASVFSFADKIAIGRAMMAFLRGLPADTEENFAHWLERHRQTRGAVDRFWRPVMVSALNDDLDRISVRYAGKVARESFLGSAAAGHMGVPTVPLSELYGHAVEYIHARGGEVRLRTNVRGMARETKSQCWSIATQADNGAGQGSSVQARAVVLALPFEAMQRLLPALPPLPAGTENTLQRDLGRFAHSPITGIHLWFDRKITDLEHAVLLDRTIQWMYHKSLLQPQVRGESPGDYIELVVSASKSLAPMPRQQIIDLAVRELAEFFPVVRGARLLKATVVKEVRATFSVTPGLDAYRPGPVTPWPGTYLAGDWTATGWPATMEGAVRSGHIAAEAVLRGLGREQKFLQPDLPMQGLMRLFG